MMKVNYKAISDIKPLEPRFDVDKAKEMLQEVSKRENYRIAKTLDENDAEGMIMGLVEKYPGLVMKILSKRYIHNLAFLETMNTFMNKWSNLGE